MGEAMSSEHLPDISVLMAEIGSGGMGKMRVHLINALADCGLAVDLVLGKDDGAHAIPVDERVRVFRLGTTHAIFAVPRLAAYLRRRRPQVLLTQRVRVNVLAHRARRLARTRTRIFATGNTHISTAIQELTSRKRQRRLTQLQRYFSRNDGVIAVSRGVAEDAERVLGWSQGSVQVAANPVVTTNIEAEMHESVDHPWFQPESAPVVLGIGRLQPQKDYPTLIRAFARLRQTHEAKLVILGEGRLRRELAACAQREGIEDNFDMPGFTGNVYAYLARSRMFVLSSAWEGSPNVLVEAMAVGTPVVATDCPSGPSEILDGGRLAPLVPVGDVAALAEAMKHVWHRPPESSQLRAVAYERYSAERSAAEYVSALGINRS